MAGKCIQGFFSFNTYVILEFQVGLGADQFTYVLQFGTACEYDLHISRWENGEGFRLFVPR
jgi:hypothetical protein